MNEKKVWQFILNHEYAIKKHEKCFNVNKYMRESKCIDLICVFGGLHLSYFHYFNKKHKQTFECERCNVNFKESNIII